MTKMKELDEEFGEKGEIPEKSEGKGHDPNLGALCTLILTYLLEIGAQVGMIVYAFLWIEGAWLWVMALVFGLLSTLVTSVSLCWVSRGLDFKGRGPARLLCYFMHALLLGLLWRFLKLAFVYDRADVQEFLSLRALQALIQSLPLTLLHLIWVISSGSPPPLTLFAIGGQFLSIGTALLMGYYVNSALTSGEIEETPAKCSKPTTEVKSSCPVTFPQCSKCHTAPEKAWDLPIRVKPALNTYINLGQVLKLSKDTQHDPCDKGEDPCSEDNCSGSGNSRNTNTLDLSPGDEREEPFVFYYPKLEERSAPSKQASRVQNPRRTHSKRTCPCRTPIPADLEDPGTLLEDTYGILICEGRSRHHHNHRHQTNPPLPAVFPRVASRIRVLCAKCLANHDPLLTPCPTLTFEQEILRRAPSNLVLQKRKGSISSDYPSETEMTLTLNECTTEEEEDDVLEPFPAKVGPWMTSTMLPKQKTAFPKEFTSSEYVQTWLLGHSTSSSSPAPSQKVAPRGQIHQHFLPRAPQAIKLSRSHTLSHPIPINPTGHSISSNLRHSRNPKGISLTLKPPPVRKIHPSINLTLPHVKKCSKNLKNNPSVVKSAKNNKSKCLGYEKDVEIIV